MLGHAQLSTTEIYTKVSIRQLKLIHSATHPEKLEGAMNNCEEELFWNLAVEEGEESQ